MPKEKGNIYLTLIILVIIIILIALAYFKFFGSNPKGKNPPQQAAQESGNLSLPNSQFLKSGSSLSGSPVPSPVASQANNPVPTSNPVSDIFYSTSTNWGVDSECNPGNGTSCTCDPQTDVSLVNHNDFMEVIANPNGKNTWVNAIADLKRPVLPGNAPLQPAKLLYSGQFKIPNIPAMDVSQKNNAQADHFMIQMYDGKNQFGWGNKITMEASFYWQLNPWAAKYGHFFVYIPNHQLVDTGINLPPDSNWHNFEIVADFVNRKWITVQVDDQTADVSTQPLALISHPDWGNEQLVIITVEAEPAWPKATCIYANSWNIYFKNTDFQIAQ